VDEALIEQPSTDIHRDDPARIRNSSLDRLFWNASAAPWKLVSTPPGPDIFSACWIASTAAPSEVVPARLKEMVVAGIAPDANHQRRRQLGHLRHPPSAGTGRRRPMADRATTASRANSASSDPASRITRYWFDWVKWIETMRWPNAS